jgi:hypothetical protein
MLNQREYQQKLLVCQARLALFFWLWEIAKTAGSRAGSAVSKYLTDNRIRQTMISIAGQMTTIWNRR